MKKLSLSDYLEQRGWQFYQDSPDGGKWMKFSPDGDYCLGVEGNTEFRNILKSYEALDKT